MESVFSFSALARFYTLSEDDRLQQVGAPAEHGCCMASSQPTCRLPHLHTRKLPCKLPNMLPHMLPCCPLAASRKHTAPPPASLLHALVSQHVTSSNFPPLHPASECALHPTQRRCRSVSCRASQHSSVSCRAVCELSRRSVSCRAGL